MQSGALTRRRLLATAVPLAAGLAGCSGSGTGTDGGPDTADAGGTDRPDPGTTGEAASFPSLSPDEPQFRNWVPAGDVQVGFQAAHNIGRIRERKADLPAGTYESQSQWAMLRGYVGIEYEELEGMLVGLSTGIVYTGSFSRGDVDSRVGGARFEDAGAQAGVSYYRLTSADQPTFLGVGERGVFLGTVDADADAPRETFVQRASVLFGTARGERTRLHERSDLYRRYTDAVGWPLVVVARPPLPMDGRMQMGTGPLGQEALSEDLRSNVQYGTGTYVAGGSLVERYWLSVADGASPAAVEDTYTSDAVRSKLGDGESLAVRRDGQVVDVARISPIQNAGGGADPVLVTLDVSVSGGQATISHVAGEAVPLSRLTVRAGGETTSAGSGTLDPGGSVTVSVPDGTDTVRVVYRPPHAEGAGTVVAES